MRLAQVLMISAILSCMGLGLFAYKAIFLNFPVVPNQEAPSWSVETKVNFIAGFAPVEIDMFLPDSTQNFALVHDDVIAPDYGQERTVGTTTGNRKLTLSRQAARGQQTIYYRTVFYQLSSAEKAAEPEKAPQPQSPYWPRQNIADPAKTNPVAIALYDIIDEAKAKSAGSRSLTMALLKTAQIIKDDAQTQPDEAEQTTITPDERMNAIRESLGDSASDAALASLILNTAGLPTRVVNGVHLDKQARNVPLIQWLEIYRDQKWQAFDLQKGSFDISKKHLAWWRGTDRLVQVKGGNHVTTIVAAKLNREDAVTQAMWQGKKVSPFVSHLSLFELPIDSQIMFMIILMVPIGGLVIALLRQLVGIPTFGTFMPVLLALSFRETGLFWGVALFCFIVMVGLFLRAYFDDLRLLVVPRLAAVLTLVVLIMAAISVITFKLGFSVGLSITLFPMVILTMTIERMSLMTEEFGAKTARKTAFFSLIAASLAYMAMSNTYATHLVFVFPELLLVILGITILLGRYNGYKLSEYFRFRALSKAITTQGAK